MQATLSFRKDNLSPEQLRAVEILEQTYAFTNMESVPSLQDIATKDAKILVRKKLRTKDLPKGDFWTWNQSRGRKNTQSINGDIDLCFYKLTTRVRASVGENPGYKLWIFNLNDKKNSTFASFLWCERGSKKDNESTTNLSSPQKQQQLNHDKVPQWPRWNPGEVDKDSVTMEIPSQSPSLAPLTFHSSSLTFQIPKPSSHNLMSTNTFNSNMINQESQRKNPELVMLPKTNQQMPSYSSNTLNNESNGDQQQKQQPTTQEPGPSLNLAPLKIPQLATNLPTISGIKQNQNKESQVSPNLPKLNYTQDNLESKEDKIQNSESSQSSTFDKEIKPETSQNENNNVHSSCTLGPLPIKRDNIEDMANSIAKVRRINQQLHENMS